jgi:hypothetical protein
MPDAVISRDGRRRRMRDEDELLTDAIARAFAKTDEVMMEGRVAEPPFRPEGERVREDLRVGMDEVCYLADCCEWWNSILPIV